MTLSHMSILRKGAYRRASWKNNLGYTDEIAIFPPGSSLTKGDFLWRLSSARIEHASAFSLFPAHDRVLVVLKGEGIRMIHSLEEGEPEDTSEVLPLQPYEFPGDIKSRCELLGGPITDFSLFMRTGEVGADVRTQEIEPNQEYTWNAEGQWNFAYVIEGALDAEIGSLEEGDTLSTPQNRACFRASTDGAIVLLVALN